MLCKNCGEELLDGSKSCPFCNTILLSTSPVSAEKPSEASEISESQNLNSLSLVTLLKRGFEAEYLKDYEKAKAYYWMAARKYNSDAEYRLGKIAEKNKNPIMAFEWYKDAIIDGNYFEAVLTMSSLLRDQEFIYRKRPAALIKNLLDFVVFLGKEAGKGKLDAFFILALLYRNRYVEEDIGKKQAATLSDECFGVVFRFCKEAIQTGDTRVMCQLATLYFNGYHVKQDKNAALELFMEAARRNNPEAMCNVGDACANVKGWWEIIPMNMNAALQWYEKAADLGSVSAMEQIKWFEEQKQKFAEASYGTNKGDYKSMMALAEMYLEGRVIGKDVPVARDLYLRAATLAKPFKSYSVVSDYGEIAYSLAQIYCEGDGVKCDYATSREWYSEAMYDGHFHAIEELAELFREGKGGRKDEKTADSLLQLAKEFSDAIAGIVEMQYKVAYKYWGWRGNWADQRKAVSWFKEIVDNPILSGNELKYKYAALYNISRLYEDGGPGLPKDKDLARAYKEESKKYEQYKDQFRKGCFITTATCSALNKPDDCYELTTFRRFRDTWLLRQDDGSALIKEYYRIAPLIVDRINRLPNSEEFYRSIWNEWLAACLTLIEQNKNEACKVRYIEMVTTLKKSLLL